MTSYRNLFLQKKKVAVSEGGGLTGVYCIQLISLAVLLILAIKCNKENLQSTVRYATITIEMLLF